MVVPFVISDFSQLLFGAFLISIKLFYILNFVYCLFFMLFSFLAKNTKSNRILRCLFGLALLPFYMMRISISYVKTGQLNIFAICFIVNIALLFSLFLAKELIRKK